MKFLALIPARYASTRFPGKPLAMIDGKAMIERVYARASELFEHCYVATDDERIAEAVNEFDGRCVMTSSGHRSGTDRCHEAAQKLSQDIEFDVVINIQGDEPFIALEQLEQLRDCFESDPTIDIATLIKPFTRDEDIFNPNSPKVVISADGFALYFSRSVVPYLRSVDPSEWQERHTFHKHIGLYGYRKDVLREITSLEPSTLEMAESLEQLRWIENGYRIKTAATTLPSYAIDTPEDLAEIEKIFKR